MGKADDIMLKNDYYLELKKLNKNPDIVQEAMLYATKDEFEKDKEYYITLGKTKYKRKFFDSTARNRGYLKTLTFKEDI